MKSQEFDSSAAILVKATFSDLETREEFFLSTPLQPNRSLRDEVSFPVSVLGETHDWLIEEELIPGKTCFVVNYNSKTEGVIQVFDRFDPLKI